MTGDQTKEQGREIVIQETEVVKPQSENMLSSLSGLVPMLAIFVVFYFLLIRPQEKKRKQQEELIGGVKKGEEVLTSGGIFGTVSKVEENSNLVELEIAKDVKVKISKSAIADITSRKKEEPKKPAEIKKVKGKK